MVQADFAYIKAFGDKQVVPVLTAIDAETGMAMALQVQDKSQQFHFWWNAYKHFYMDVAEHKQFWAQQLYTQIRKIIWYKCWKPPQ